MTLDKTRWLEEIEARYTELRKVLTDKNCEPDEAFKVITRSLCGPLRADRVAIWAIDADDSGLVSYDLFNALTGKHHRQVKLRGEGISRFISRLRADDEMVVEVIDSPVVTITSEDEIPWPPAASALMVASTGLPPKHRLLSATRITAGVPWQPEDIAYARAAANFLPILFYAQESRKSVGQLKHSLALLTGTLDSIEENIVATDLSRGITLANHRFMELIGRPQDDPSSIRGTTIRELLLCRTKFPEKAWADSELLYQNPEISGFHQIPMKNGQMMERYSRPLFIDGKIVGRIFSYRDITERLQGEQMLKELEAELRQSQKIEAVGTLAGGIAHDFNNILSGIACNLELMRGDLPADHPAMQSLQEIAQGTKRATDLIKQILTFSRQSDYTRKAIDPVRVLGEAVSLVKATLPKMIELDCQQTLPLPHVMADATAIHQVVVNLCTNAMQAIGEAAGTIKISARRIVVRSMQPQAQDVPAGSYLHLCVRDNGCGMDQATLDRVFEPFFTTKPIGVGTGLGLSVVHGIVRSHHGFIKVASKPGKGTCFDLYFPECPKAAAPAPEDEKAIPMGQGELILFVDDEPVLSRVGEKLLNRLGYRIAAFTEGFAAYEAFKKKPDAYSAVICDLSMPHISGLDLVALLRQVRPDVPVILVTGNPSKIDQERIAAANLRQTLTKPLSGTALATALQRAIHGDTNNGSVDVPPKKI